MKIMKNNSPHLLSFNKEALSNMDDYDKTCLESALVGVCNIVQQEWGGAIPCQVRKDQFCFIALKLNTAEVPRVSSEFLQAPTQHMLSLLQATFYATGIFLRQH